MICPHCYGKGERGSIEWNGLKVCANCQGCGIVHCCEGDKANPYHGSSLEDFLDDEGFLEAATERALKDVYEWEYKVADEKAMLSICDDFLNSQKVLHASMKRRAEERKK